MVKYFNCTVHRSSVIGQFAASKTQISPHIWTDNPNLLYRRVGV